MTKDEKNSELVQRAVAKLKIQTPPDGVTGAAAIKAYYNIFNGPVRWKAGIRAPQETTGTLVKLNPGFKRSRAKLVPA